MDKDKLKARIAMIEKDIQQCMANYNALMGAKNEAEFWLKQLPNEVDSEFKEVDKSP